MVIIEGLEKIFHLGKLKKGDDVGFVYETNGRFKFLRGNLSFVSDKKYFHFQNDQDDKGYLIKVDRFSDIGEVSPSIEDSNKFKLIGFRIL